MLALTGKSFKIATINILTELKKSTVTWSKGRYDNSVTYTRDYEEKDRNCSVDPNGNFQMKWKGTVTGI
jgi:hypothetical protein